MPITKKFWTVWFVIVLTLIVGSMVFSGPVRAQVAGAMLKAEIAGAAVPKAQVSIIDVATGVTHTVTTDSAEFMPLPTGVPASIRSG